MKKNKAFLLMATLSVSIMMILSTIMLIVIGNHGETEDSGAQSTTETSLDVENTGRKEENQGGRKEQKDNSEEKEAGDGKIYLSDEVLLALDDSTIREVEEESTYVNTIELLPSLYYEREPVSKKRVSTENFLKSRLGTEIQTLSFQGYQEKTEQKISLPTEVFLYNVEGETEECKKSNSCEIVATIEGEENYIRSIGWSTKDSGKLALSKTSGNRVVVSRSSDFTGTMAVTAVVTYYTGEKSTATENMEIVVHVLDMEDSDTALFDVDGNPLYLDENGKTPAHLSDYAGLDSFYGAIRLWGWQTVDNKTYYFDRNGWPVTGDQIIGGMKYSFDQDGVLVAGAMEKGIDVSLYQKEIDWEQVAASGVTFAIIRCGFRGAVTGKLVEDSYFRRNMEGAKAAGIRVGVYFFTQAISEEEAIEEANMVLSLCKNYTLDLPIFIDTENAVDGRANGLDNRTRTDYIKKFCDTIQSNGYTPGVYASKNWYYEKVYAKELENYCNWVAQYSDVCDYEGKKDFWQYSSKEQINGIQGNVDVNIRY